MQNNITNHNTNYLHENEGSTNSKFLLVTNHCKKYK